MMKRCKKQIRAIGLCENEKLWVNIDETTDSSNRKVGNVVVGVFKNDKIVIVKCKELPAANHITTARLFNETMHGVLLFIINGARHMKKTN